MKLNRELQHKKEINVSKYGYIVSLAVAMLAMSLATPIMANSASDESDTSSIDVRISKLQSGNGKVIINLFDDEEGFPADADKTVQRVTAPANDPHYVFKNIPKGKYVITVCHDENANNECDTNFIGIPKEGVGVSNNPHAFLHPSYRDGIFNVGDHQVKLTIDLDY